MPFQGSAQSMAGLVPGTRHIDLFKVHARFIVI
jgi:hypothetical protein